MQLQKTPPAKKNAQMHCFKLTIYPVETDGQDSCNPSPDHDLKERRKILTTLRNICSQDWIWTRDATGYGMSPQSQALGMYHQNSVLFNDWTVKVQKQHQ